MSESKADRLAPWFGVLGRTPFDLFLYWRIRFPSPSTSPGCDNLSARRCTLKGPGTSCLCVAGHKSPRLLSASISRLAISGKVSQFFGDTSLVGVGISVGGSQVSRRRKRQAVKCKRPISSTCFSSGRTLPSCQLASCLKWARVLPSRPVTTHL